MSRTTTTRRPGSSRAASSSTRATIHTLVDGTDSRNYADFRVAGDMVWVSVTAPDMDGSRNVFNLIPKNRVEGRDYWRHLLEQGWCPAPDDDTSARP